MVCHKIWYVTTYIMSLHYVYFNMMYATGTQKVHVSAVTIKKVNFAIIVSQISDYRFVNY
jgi:hypothetical protein